MRKKKIQLGTKKRVVAEWRPKAETPIIDKQGVTCNRDGEPTLLPLTRWENDKALHGQLHNGCCDCGLEHLLTFAVFRDGDGQFWLSKRAYRK